MKDVAESRRVGKLVRAVEENKQCYYLAAYVVMNLPEYARADYVERLAVVNGLPIQHGWVEKDGVIIDPAWPEREAVYFPGLRFHGRRDLAAALRIPKPEHTEDFPIFYRFGWGGIDSPDFRAACIAAYRHAGMEAAAKVYEEYKPRARR